MSLDQVRAFFFEFAGRLKDSPGLHLLNSHARASTLTRRAETISTSRNG